MYFVLHNFWLLFDHLFKYFGIYPCQKVGEDKLRQISACHFWGLFIGFTLLYQTIFSGLLVGIIFVWTSPKDLLDNFIKKAVPSLMDKMVLALTVGNLHQIYFACLGHLHSFGNGLSMFQEFINNKAIMDKSMINQRIITYAKCLISVLLLVLSGFMNHVGVTYTFNKEINLSTMWMIVVIFCFTLMSIPSFIPIFYFTFSYMEIVNALSIWSKTIIQSEMTYDFLVKVRDFMDALKLARKIISPFLFWIIWGYFLQAIIMSYFTIATIMNENTTLGWEKICSIISCFVFDVWIIYLFHMYCSMSEHIIDQINCLRERVMDFDQQSNQQDMIYSALSEFQGFDAKGYFTLNNSLLTGMITNFATLLVILVQFKQSEI